MSRFALFAAFLCGALGAQASTHYTINLIRDFPDPNTNPGIPFPTSSGFDYDAGTGIFSNFAVNWFGGTYDFSTAASNPTASGFWGNPLHSSCPAASSNPVTMTPNLVLQWLLDNIPQTADGSGFRTCQLAWSAVSGIPNVFGAGTHDEFAFAFCSSTEVPCTAQGGFGFTVNLGAWLVTPPDGLYVSGSSPGTGPGEFELGHVQVSAAAPVPEPATWSFILAGLVFGAFAGRARTKSVRRGPLYVVDDEHLNRPLGRR
jgi:hypothetical protein